MLCDDCWNAALVEIWRATEFHLQMAFALGRELATVAL